ncbi:class I SAM-dependent methyltransferase [Lacibacterium aquatile]|uniref:Class I SAM-dependent methyltransferase n=1 Tax=Lacibacterium aquatile TaxID=1168082 RepID=A0ABW5DXN8_9PROT
MGLFGRKKKPVVEALPEEEEPLLLTDLAPDQPHMMMAEEPGKLWPISRIEAAEQIWGEENLGPGNLNFSMELLNPVGINSETNIVDLAARVGATGRELRRRNGTWVTSLEPDPDLAKDGQARSTRQDLDKKSPVRTYDPNEFELKEGGFDCVFAREMFYLVPDKARLYNSIVSGLKPRGQLIFTDFLVTRAGAVTADMEAWYAYETPRPTPWSLAQTTDTLQGEGMDVRIAADITDRYRDMIVQAWVGLSEKLEKGAIPRHLLKAVASEAERWAAFRRCLDAGSLVVYRFHAFR